MLGYFPFERGAGELEEYTRHPTLEVSGEHLLGFGRVPDQVVHDFGKDLIALALSAQHFRRDVCVLCLRFHSHSRDSGPDICN